MARLTARSIARRMALQNIAKNDRAFRRATLLTPTIRFAVAAAICLAALCSQAAAGDGAFDRFLQRMGIAGEAGQETTVAPAVTLVSAAQDFGVLTADASCHTHTPLKLGNQDYKTGLGTHANSLIVFQLDAPFVKFVADVGIDNNEDTRRAGTTASAVFIVKCDGREVAKTPVCRCGEPPRHLEIALEKVRKLELVISDAGDGIPYDQADWADARLIAAEGKTIGLSSLVPTTFECPLLRQTMLPASFVYGGETSETLLAKWPRTEKPVVEANGRRIHEITWREPEGGLAATWHIEVLKDRPAAEFRWIFENMGKEACKPLTDVLALDLRATGVGQAIELLHSSGGLTGPFTGEPAAFLVGRTELKGPKTLSAAGGRSSNKDLPFFVLHDRLSNGGVYVGVGWSGQWQADFAPDGAGHTLRVTAGMPGMNLALPGGERIASPNILFGAYRGDSQAGSNALRRTLDDHYVALLGDQKPLPPVSWNHWFTFTNRVSEALLKQQLNAMGDIGIEYFCIDAGWFNGDFPGGVGNWTINREKFPQGLAPIGKLVADRGMKLGLWFEPARADAGTQLQREHPEWMTGNQVRLEIPAARDWIFQMMCGFIDEGHVRWIRYDYNFDPLAGWNQTDTPETRGLTQIKYILGEYELFDRLRARYPDLLIESCSSGGRRIDLETMRRAHTYWKSDETSNTLAARAQETGANVFLPGGLLNTNLPATAKATPFDLHSLFGGPLGFATDWTKLDAATLASVRQEIAAYKTVRHLLNKDYYPLLPQTYEASQWVGWEFLDPATGEGFCVVLRPEQSVYAAADVRLRGLDADKKYKVSRLDGSQARTLLGKELAAGMTISLGGNGSEVLKFQRED